MGLSPPFGLAEGARVTLDSTPLIYYLEDHKTFKPLYAPLFMAEADGLLEFVISSIAVAEILTGPFKAGNEALANRYRKTLSSWEIVVLDVELATLAARLRASHKLKLPDAIHAATAISTGSAALVTHDRDFSGLKGMRIINGSA